MSKEQKKAGFYPNPDGEGTVYINEEGKVVNPVSDSIKKSIKKHWPHLKHFTLADEVFEGTKKIVDIMTSIGKSGDKDLKLDLEKQKAYGQEYQDKRTIHPDCEAEYGYPCSVYEYKRRKQFEGRYERGE
tara:strand:- start:1915 stop:2304 length:390 start_codon:yes stop_codon:yes gene_type:complete